MIDYSVESYSFHGFCTHLVKKYRENLRSTQKIFSHDCTSLNMSSVATKISSNQRKQANLDLLEISHETDFNSRKKFNSNAKCSNDFEVLSFV